MISLKMKFIASLQTDMMVLKFYNKIKIKSNLKQSKLIQYILNVNIKKINQTKLFSKT